MCVTGQHRERDAVFTGHRFDLIETVGPVGRAAEQTQHDELRAGQGLFDIEINRQIVLELQQIGEAE